MAIYKQDIVNIDLDSGSVFRSFAKITIGTADKAANRFGIRAFRNGVECDLSGASCYGYFRDPQGNNIALTSYGTVSGNEAYVTLPPACYNYEGQFCLAIKLLVSGVTSTVRIIDGVVDNTNTGSAVAPTSAVPSYSEILSTYDQMVAAVAVANGAIATTFNAATVYPAGSYVINDGALYLLPAGHAANVTWANTSKVATNFGAEVTALKSNIKSFTGNEWIAFTNEGYIKLNVATVDPTPVENASYKSVMISCQKGDTFVLNGSSYGAGALMYAFLNSAYEKILYPSSGITAENLAITAPDGTAYLAVNNYNNTVTLQRNIALQNRVSDLEVSTGKDKTLHSKTDALMDAFSNGVLGQSVFTTGYVMRNTDGIIVTTTNNRYYAAIPVYIDISAYAGKKITIESDGNYTNWVKLAFFNSSDELIGETIQIDSTTYPFIQYSVPQNAASFNIAAYSAGNALTESSIATTKAVFVGAEIPEPETNTKLSLNVPDYYELVVGDTFQLFYRGIVLAAHDTDYDIVITCAKGNAYSKYFQYTPAVAGNVDMTITLYDAAHKQVDTATLTLKVKQKATSPGSMKTVLYVGDSLTSGGYAPGEFKRRIAGTGGTPEGDGLTNIQYIGTKNNNNCNYEGQGGWTFKKYNEESMSNDVMWITCVNHGKTDGDQHSIYKDSNNKEWKLETIETNRIMIIRESSSGTLPSTGTLTWVSGGVDSSNIVYTASEQAPGNPFWDSDQGKVDFGTYATRMGVSSIDYVYVLLGWNGAGGSDSAIITQVTTFIDNVLASFPSCKIVLLGLEVPSRDGLGVSYGASGLYSRYFDLLSYVFHLNDIYKGIAESDEYTGKAFFVNVSGQFDTEHNMMTGTRQVNTRNSTTETYQKNGVHPAVSGYYQIADACYRDFMHRLQDT